MDWSPFVPHAAEGSPPRDIPARCCALHEAHAQACWCACMRHRQVGFPAEGVPFMGCRANGGAAASPWGKPNPKAGIRGSITGSRSSGGAAQRCACAPLARPPCRALPAGALLLLAIVLLILYSNSLYHGHMKPTVCACALVKCGCMCQIHEGFHPPALHH